MATKIDELSGVTKEGSDGTFCCGRKPAGIGTSETTAAVVELGCGDELAALLALLLLFELPPALLAAAALTGSEEMVPLADSFATKGETDEAATVDSGAREEADDDTIDDSGVARIGPTLLPVSLTLAMDSLEITLLFVMAMGKVSLAAKVTLASGVSGAEFGNGASSNGSSSKA